MKVDADITNNLIVDENGFICCNGLNYKQFFRNSEGLHTFATIINELGILSAKSQNLRQVITSLTRFSASDQRIYLKVEKNRVLGFVRVGQKRLFYRDYIGSIRELTPTCVLDIYVHESCQRMGIGKEIFNRFLLLENQEPRKLAYDRPSPKLINFLKKHYELVRYIPQNNNFVIFDDFFYPTTINTERKPLETNRIQLTERKPPQPIDSLQLLQRELESKKSNGNLVKRVENVGYRVPWVRDDEKLTFRTTSNAYGSHYRYYLQR